MPQIDAIRRRLADHGQEHLLRFYDKLDPARQAALISQIESINFDELDRLIESHVKSRPQTQLAGKIEPPPVVLQDQTPAQKLDQARNRGLEAIAAGKVAAFVVAGGQGTRLGYEGPKGCLEATPVTKKPLFQAFAEQILAAGRRAGVTIPWYIMTSPSNDVVVRAFFRQYNYFGLNSKDVFFLTQGQMPAMDYQGKILLAEPGQIAASPNGHGGSLYALADSGALADMAKRGIEYISYFQVDNPLVHIIDPLFLGLHAMAGAQMSAKSLPKRDPMEKLGNFCLLNGRITVIEYSDMPEELARACTDDGRLRFSAGSIAIHIISRSFAEKLTAPGSKSHLPYHRADKIVSFVDAQGTVVRPDQPNAVKLEMFVFDALPMADKAVILQTKRDEEFSPIKNASGEDSLPTSLHDQIRRAAAWLERAGVKVPRDADGQVVTAIEISPLFADSPEELAAKVNPNMTIATGESVYLGQRGQVGGRSVQAGKTT